jgi:hypothetical protein
MCSKQKRILYTVSFKLSVIKYVKEHGNRAGARHFGPSLTEKMVCERRKQVEELQMLHKSKHSFHTHISQSLGPERILWHNELGTKKWI